MIDLKTLPTYEGKIDAIINGETSLSDSSRVVAMYLTDFRPTLPPGPGGDNATSLEIMSYLEDIAVITEADVTAVMLALGYRLYCNEYDGYEWSLTHVDA